ncbi:RNA polymerase ECF-type sigma factor [Catenovulum agarivorans DS-2]|uniref:RNA polymerase sigma factor n=1 Tax=Catenovulum agarivorans DS-2 TaxID=1328313 RepID=W7QFM7_9ALTE|nr:sigma-70 family RNA polymerase sigma factor [Catenovulum agarivorans]EWH11719.1 RNA polymerase ECF-type sigma factor [Catenovulum agarivorans DS-2]
MSKSNLFTNIRSAQKETSICRLGEFLNSDEESEVIRLAQQGNDQAFAEIIKRYQSDVRAFLAVRMQNISEADDIAQEAFIIAYKKLNEFDIKRSIRPWLKGIALNLLKDYFRKNGGRTSVDISDFEEVLSAEIESELSNHSEDSMLIALEQCLEKVDDKFHTLIKQHYTEGYTVDELTKLHQVKHSAMTMRLHRIRERLRNCIDKRLTGTMA